MRLKWRAVRFAKAPSWPLWLQATLRCYARGTLAALLDTHRRGEAAATILSAEVPDPTGYGRIVRDGEGRVSAIVEEKSATPRTARNSRSEFQHLLLHAREIVAVPRPRCVRKMSIASSILPMPLDCFAERNERVLAYIAADPQEVLGCNTRGELAETDRVLRARKSAELMDSGVTMYLPETIFIDPEVVAGPDTVIEPGAQLLGKTRIGARCKIRRGKYFAGRASGQRCDDRRAFKPRFVPRGLARAGGPVRAVAARARTFAPERGVGSFVELKNTVLHEGARAPHLSYLGDATIGADSNIGAGTITCNYDGFAKHETKIGSRVFIGSDTALVAPVRVGDGAYVGGWLDHHGKCARRCARHRPRTPGHKPGWAKARRRKAAAQTKHAQPVKRRASRRTPRRAKSKSRRRR